jgi:hypothetical protein
MKLTLSMLCLLLAFLGKAQTLLEFQRAMNSNDRAVQAIHGYPANIGGGKCHWVPVTVISLNGEELTIVETWQSQLGIAKTVMKGKLVNGTVSGAWSSTFSSGNWSYSFSSAKGRWNKPKSTVEAFSEQQPLRFRIVAKQALKDGPYDCN